MPIQFQLKINHFQKMKHNLPLENTKKKTPKKNEGMWLLLLSFGDILSINP